LPLIKALAAKGGVIGVAGWSPILHRGDRRRPTLDDLAAAAMHVVRRVGPDHVAVGTDLCDDLTPTAEAWGPVYGPTGTFPEVCGNLGNRYSFEANMAKGLETIDQMPNLAPALASAFPGREQLEKVLGRNALRVLTQAMRSAL
jgi:microsomal dipeptidase-like Zn-dependent dipeptidase